MTRNLFIRNAAIVALTLILCILAAWGFLQLGLHNESVFMAFIIGVMIAVLETKSFLSGVTLSILLVLCFNFLFTEPRFTFYMYDVNYLVSLICFVVAALIVGSLATRLQKEAQEAVRSRKLTERLFGISKGFLNLPSEDVCRYGQRVISEQLGRHVRIVIGDPADEEGFPDSDTDSSPCAEEAAAYCYRESIPCGQAEAFFSQAGALYIPLKSKNDTAGVIAIASRNEEKGLDDDERRFVDTIASQIVLVAKRGELELETRRSALAVEREKLRNNLLRSMSHDIRTPLTGIAGGADFLLHQGGNADEETRMTILQDIQSDALWLSEMTDNLLSITRLQDEDFAVSKKIEVVDDVLSDAITRSSKWRGQHELIVRHSDTIILASMDGKLITQALVNLIDNAFKHTRADSSVEVCVEKSGGEVIFSVSDDGGGIDDSLFDKIFTSFFSTDDRGGSTAGQKRSAGLGLSICRTIVEAHGGHITAFNNERGGATFNFTLPFGDEDVEPDPRLLIPEVVQEGDSASYAPSLDDALPVTISASDMHAANTKEGTL